MKFRLPLRCLAALAVALGAAASRGFAVDADAELAVLATQLHAKGPNGETPSPAAKVTLTDDELARIRALRATAAIVLHYGGNDWSRALTEGLKAQFAKMGIEVIAVTDAGFKPEKQVSDIETVLARKPTVMAAMITDPIATAGAFRKAADQGVKLVFNGNVPRGLVPGKDYLSVVAADNYGNGVAAALLMAKALHGKGNIGVIHHAADFFVTRQRYEAFKATIAKFPGIKIVADQGVGGPDFSGDAERVASAMLVSRRGINGIWAVWDVPAEGVMSAARSAGRENLVITTCDLGENVAIEMALDGLVKGLGAQTPYDHGVTEAIVLGYGLLGKEVPVYLAYPALPVTKENLLQAWRTVYHQEPPKNVKNSLP